MLYKLIDSCLQSSYSCAQKFCFPGASEDSKFNMLDLLMKSSGEKARESKSRETTESSLENWTGRWMPDRAGDPTPPPKIFPIGSSEEAAAIHRQSMGPNKACDDGKVKNI